MTCHILHTKVELIKDYSGLDEESLVAEVQSINWDAVFANDQIINSIFESFHQKITEVIDNHVPLRKLSKKESCSIKKVMQKRM